MQEKTLVLAPYNSSFKVNDIVTGAWVFSFGANSYWNKKFLLWNHFFFFIFKGKRIEIFNEVSYQMLSEYHALVFYQQNQTLKSTNSVANEKNSKQMHEFWGWHVGFKRDSPTRNLTLKLTFFIQLKKDHCEEEAVFTEC